MADTKKAPTIQDVARHAGVSTATVSRALSAPERVSEEKRGRIFEAIQLTGYSINQAARSLRSKEARNILLALPNIGNPYYSTILDAVVNEATRRGYGVMVVNRLGEDPTSWLRDYVYSNRADGMILFDARIDRRVVYDAVSDERMPLVVVCDEVLAKRFNLVTTDNFEGSRRATRHLIEYGHRRIGCIAGHNYPGARNERTAGFLAEMREAALTPAIMLEGDHTMRCGLEAAHRIAAMDVRPTAMVCANDETAIGLISEARKLGINCPRDLSVVGYDDINVAAFINPPLTTVRQDRNEIGATAVKVLLDVIEEHKPVGRGKQVMLRSELIVRASTGPVPRERRLRLPIAGLAAR